MHERFGNKNHLLEKSSFTVLAQFLEKSSLRIHIMFSSIKDPLEGKINMNVCNNINVINTLSSQTSFIHMSRPCIRHVQNFNV